MYCFRGELSCFGTELTLRTFTNPLFPSGIQEISVRRHILSTDTLYILHPYKQTTEYISKRASQQAGGEGEPCFLNSEMPKKIHASQYQPNDILAYPLAVRHSFYHDSTIAACIIT